MKFNLVNNQERLRQAVVTGFGTLARASVPRAISGALGCRTYVQSSWKKAHSAEYLLVFHLPPRLYFPLFIRVMGACLVGDMGAHGCVARSCQPLVQSPSCSCLPTVEALGWQVTYLVTLITRGPFRSSLSWRSYASLFSWWPQQPRLTLKSKQNYKQIYAT